VTGPYDQTKVGLSPYLSYTLFAVLVIYGVQVP
jgi:hypothetical protein